MKKLSDFTYLTKGGFGEISRAKWIDGSIKEWSHKENKFQREQGEDAVLKSFPNSSNICQTFLHEVLIFSFAHRLVIFLLININEQKKNTFVNTA
jgi:hypothetical protein